MKTLYPKCANTFRQWINSNKNYHNLFISLGEPSLFDVTLRDGLQGLNKEEQNTIYTFDKLQIYNDIIRLHNPKSIEIGSIVSKKILPIFKDTLNLFGLINHFDKNLNIDNKKYILIPNKEKLQNIINNPLINYLSFITSASNSFQLKNTKKSLNDCDNDIIEMLYALDENPNRSIKPVIKLYMSCINECPIEGKIANDFIVNRLLKFHKMNIDNICISDTCGSLEPDDFEYIVDKCTFFGLPMSKISLHLHVKPERVTIVEKIIWKALDRKIVNFDVSNFKTGGCSITMDKSKLASNLSYELYYKALYKYIVKKSN